MIGNDPAPREGRGQRRLMAISAIPIASNKGAMLLGSRK